MTNENGTSGTLGSFARRARGLGAMLPGLLLGGALAGCEPPPGPDQTDEVEQSDDTELHQQALTAGLRRALPAVAYDGSGKVLVVWEDDEGSPGTSHIFMRLFSNTGKAVTSAKRLTSSPLADTAASVSWGGSRFLVTYTSAFSAFDNDVKAIEVNTSGTVLKTNSVAISNANEGHASSAWLSSLSLFAISYHVGDSIRLRYYKPSTGVVGSEIFVAPSGYGPVIAAGSGSIAMAWNSPPSGGDFNENLHLFRQYLSQVNPPDLLGGPIDMGPGVFPSITYNTSTKEFGIGSVEFFFSGGTRLIGGRFGSVSATCLSPFCAINEARYRGTSSSTDHESVSIARLGSRYVLSMDNDFGSQSGEIAFIDHVGGVVRDTMPVARSFSWPFGSASGSDRAFVAVNQRNNGVLDTIKGIRVKSDGTTSTFSVAP